MAVSPRERNLFACLVDTVVAPGGDLPAVAQTDVVEFLDGYLADSPRANRLGMRALLHALELAPLVLGFGARMRRLPAKRRRACLEALARTPAAPALQALEALAKTAYYGDRSVMRGLGYDAGEVVGRAQAVRVAEGRW